MLVLTRTCDQEIRIGDDIVVRVLNVKGDRVRLGVQAPADVSVHRQEVYLEIMNANRESLAVDAVGLERAQQLLRGNAGLLPASRGRASATDLAPARRGNKGKSKGKEAGHGTQD
ncbi:MAG: carbon storage regulator CsrA [Planctomycetota bacterium]